MAFHDDDLRDMLRTLGTPGMCGIWPILGKFKSPNQNITIFAGEVNSDAPTYLMVQGDIDAIGIDIGSPISIKGVGYIVTDLKAEDSGFVRLSLTRDCDE